MHIFEIQDVLFAIKSLKSPTRNFDINRHITFTQEHTRSSTNKLIHHLHINNLNRNSYFRCLPRLWNALPVIDTNLSIATIKAKLKKFMWNHFVDHFDTLPTILFVHAANVTISQHQTFRHFN